MNASASTLPPYLSVVIPVYGCADCLAELYRRLGKALTSITSDYQIIFVNDHSPDGSWAVVKELATYDARVLGLNLSRNFGQHAALTAGLDRATGDWVVVIDCDLQDMPEEIPQLHAYALLQQLDVVFARRNNRQDTVGKRWAGHLFHRLLAWLGGPAQDPASSNFGIFHRRVVAALRCLREPTRAFALQVCWLGFRRGALDVQHAARAHGKSSYRFGHLVKLAFDVLLAYSDKPLRLLVKLGVGILTGAMLYAAYQAGLALYGKELSSLVGLLISVWFLGGLTLTALGVVGLYVARTFDGVKSRPIYVVRDEV